MLAPPPGETFDGLDETLPTKAPINIDAPKLPSSEVPVKNVPPEQVPLLQAEESEASEVESTRKGKVRNVFFVFFFLLLSIHWYNGEEKIHQIRYLK